MLDTGEHEFLEHCSALEMEVTPPNMTETLTANLQGNVRLTPQLPEEKSFIFPDEQLNIQSNGVQAELHPIYSSHI